MNINQLINRYNHAIDIFNKTANDNNCEKLNSNIKKAFGKIVTFSGDKKTALAKLNLVIFRIKDEQMELDFSTQENISLIQSAMRDVGGAI
jgi:hypothetical protein